MKSGGRRTGAVERQSTAHNYSDSRHVTRALSQLDVRPRPARNRAQTRLRASPLRILAASARRKTPPASGAFSSCRFSKTPLAFKRQGFPSNSFALANRANSIERRDRSGSVTQLLSWTVAVAHLKGGPGPCSLPGLWATNTEGGKCAVDGTFGWEGIRGADRTPPHRDPRVQPRGHRPNEAACDVQSLLADPNTWNAVERLADMLALLGELDQAFIDRLLGPVPASPYDAAFWRMHGMIEDAAAVGPISRSRRGSCLWPWSQPDVRTCACLPR